MLICGLPTCEFMIIAKNKQFSPNVTHPTITKLLEVIGNEQASNEILIEQASIGIDISQPNKNK